MYSGQGLNQSFVHIGIHLATLILLEQQNIKNVVRKHELFTIIVHSISMA